MVTEAQKRAKVKYMSSESAGLRNTAQLEKESITSRGYENAKSWRVR